jgi:hypothetical protein
MLRPRIQAPTPSKPHAAKSSSMPSRANLVADQRSGEVGRHLLERPRAEDQLVEGRIEVAQMLGERRGSTGRTRRGTEYDTTPKSPGATIAAVAFASSTKTLSPSEVTKWCWTVNTVVSFGPGPTERMVAPHGQGTPGLFGRSHRRQGNPPSAHRRCLIAPVVSRLLARDEGIRRTSSIAPLHPSP